MLKKLTVTLALVCLMLTAAAPARANDVPVDTLKQFMKLVVDENDAGAWAMLNTATQKWIVTLTYEQVHQRDASITEKQVADLFSSQNPKALGAFFGGFRKETDFAHMLANGKFQVSTDKGQTVVLVIDGDKPWGSVMVQENGAWKLDLEATAKLAQ